MIRILFLASNPADTVRLRLDEEVRAIERTLRQADLRDKFQLTSSFAVRVSDLQDLLLRYKPDIVHFSGHGSTSSELIFQDENANSHPIPTPTLAKLFQILKDNIKCVVLSACYSESQARAIAQHIDVVIGMSDAIEDKSALKFATAFYRGLAYGKDVHSSFELGKLEIQFQNAKDQELPKILVRENSKEITFLENIIPSNTLNIGKSKNEIANVLPEQVSKIQDKIRERTDFLYELLNRASSPNAPSNIVSWITEIKTDISQLKKQANTIYPGLYKDIETTQTPHFHNLPPQSFFTGRDNFVAEILDSLNPEDRAWVVSIDGLGGIGKTSLVRKVAFQSTKSGLFDEIIWSTAQQRLLTPTGIISVEQDQYLVELDDLLDEICQAFGYLTPIEFSFEDKIKAVNVLLKQRRCLLVLDNLETLADAKPIASFLRKTPFPTKSLVTSRQLFSVGEGEKFVRLPPMSWLETSKLIEHESKEKNVELSEAQANQLFELCCGIPAALTWSIGRMAFTRPNIVLSDLKSQRNVNDLTTYCFHSAFKTIRVQNPLAVKVFFILSFFPFPVTIEALRAISQISRESDFERVLQELNLLSLIKISNQDTIETLPIVRQFARRDFASEVSLEKEARQRLAGYMAQKSSDSIYLFTPTNELIALPREATPVDFAYRVHTSIGNRYVTAKVNGQEVKPTYILQNGDQVAIVISSKSEGPKLEWARTDRAKRSIRGRHKLFINKFITPIRQGNALCRNGALQDAIQKYTTAISADPADKWAHNRLGHTFRLIGDLNQAIHEHQTALSFDTKDPFAYYGIGAVNYQRGWYDDAIQNYKIALELKPDYVNALCGLGRVFCVQKDYKSAEPALRQAISASAQIKAQTPRLHLFLSLSLIGQGRENFSEAENNLSIALRQFARVAKSNFRTLAGTHLLYLYSIALMTGNSASYEGVLREAISYCFARGLRDEVKADLEIINMNEWEPWIAYASQKTSKISIKTSPRDIILYLNSL